MRTLMYRAVNLWSDTNRFTVPVMWQYWSKSSLASQSLIPDCTNVRDVSDRWGTCCSFLRWLVNSRYWGIGNGRNACQMPCSHQSVKSVNWTFILVILVSVSQSFHRRAGIYKMNMLNILQNTLTAQLNVWQEFQFRHYWRRKSYFQFNSPVFQFFTGLSSRRSTEFHFSTVWIKLQRCPSIFQESEFDVADWTEMCC